jgi:CBS domain-containing protein
MITDIKTVSKYDKLSDVAQIMMDSNIRGLPVVDDETNKLIGIITIRDLLKSIAE